MTSPNPVTGVEAAVQFALAQVGKPYVWGTMGPDTFDCSGLVAASFRRAGFKISRVTYTQIRDGTGVAQGSMARGDLWFTDPGHVAIYLGGGQMVEAPNSRSKVRVVPVRKFFAGRRIGPPSGVAPGGGGMTVPAGLIPDISGLQKAEGIISNPHTWMRMLAIIAGLVLFFVLVQSQISGSVFKMIRKVVG